MTGRRVAETVQQVRWRQGNTWRYGHIGTEPVEADGSVRVWEATAGGARSLPARVLQHETRGPRGGHRWEWVTTRPAPVVTAVCAVRPAWNPPAGPAEMFNQAGLFEMAP